ncbi:MAG: ABC transporter permease [Elusimicrobia bacterium]|nr:ABC transporter permease [Elusimicrobiota bacterium]
MKKYIFKRLLASIPVFFGITILSFVIMRLAPGSPVDTVSMSPGVDTRARERLYSSYGLERPLHIQYLSWLKRVVTLDFGESFRDGEKVSSKIIERLPATLFLNLSALILIFSLSIPIGVISAVKQNTIIDRGLTFFVFLGYSIPSFALALLLMYFFGLKLGWLPVSGIVSVNFEFLSPMGKLADIILHLILPVMTLGLSGLAFISRYMRSSMLEVIGKDYIRAARARGVSEKSLIFNHAFKNALIPVVTMVGLLIPGLIGGSVVFETIFSWPGMGRLAYSAIMSRDYPVIMGVGVIMAVLTLLGNLLSDIGYAAVDPRIRYRS